MIRIENIKTIIVVDMKGQQKSTSISKKKERVRLYKKKMQNTDKGRQHRVGRVNCLKCIASKSNKKLLNLTTQVTILEKTVNKTAACNKLLQRYKQRQST